MKVLLVGPVPPPNGGMAMQTAQLQQLLGAEPGLSVQLLAVNAPYKPAWVGKLPLLRALCRLIPYLWQLYRSTKHVDVVHLMANSGWAWHLFACPALLIARWHGTAVIVNYRGGSAQQFLQRQHRLVLPLLKQAAAVVTPSRYLQRVFAGYQLEAQVIANIINTAMFSPRACIAPTGVIHIVVTRNLEPLYDIATAIRCFALLQQDYPHSRLSIAGSGPALPGLQQLVAELQLLPSVCFVGRLEREAMVALYQSADLMLNPSTVDNMPNSVLEALACGVAVVSTNVGGIPDMVTDGEHALLVPPRRPDLMAAACAQLLQQPALADTLRRNGLALVHTLQPQAVLPQWLQLYRQSGKANA
ncbi:glycosyltransferase family 4 protein [Rheinheimera sp. NSM]|uniref:glycosyltransferase family 4 protein n=1 Tax=Rheinheimera sp. NSM TaxID=3457884 RepID=UPI004036CF47